MMSSDNHKINYLKYGAGFLVSIFLTAEAYLLVVNHVLKGQGLIVAILALAIVQFMVQMFFFLHLGQEGRPRWRLMSFLMMIGVVLILVVGSLWIMYNLNYSHNSMPDGTHDTEHVNKYLDSQDGL